MISRPDQVQKWLDLISVIKDNGTFTQQRTQTICLKCKFLFHCIILVHHGSMQGWPWLVCKSRINLCSTSPPCCIRDHDAWGYHAYQHGKQESPTPPKRPGQRSHSRHYLTVDLHYSIAYITAQELPQSSYFYYVVSWSVSLNKSQVFHS